ncbi:MAG TPA: hypothetical protein DD381_08710 [Lentisphaeria bacterium]|nr:hypothetical protein [Lentisphaeria bacterium]
MLSVFLTGGTGFFGKNILRKLQSDVKLTILSRNPENFINEFPELIKGHEVSFVKGDIRDFKLPPDLVFDYVIHGATEASAKLEKENPQEMYSVIVDGTKHLLKQITGRGIKRLLFISSGGVYGQQPADLSNIPETYPPSPITYYGKGKLEAERLCVASGIASVIARCFAFVGPYLPLDTHFAIGNFILNGLKNDPIIIKGDGRPYRSYMYADDLINWLWSILLKGKVGEIYNVGSEEAISIADLARLVSSCFTDKPEVKILGIPTQNPKLITQNYSIEPLTTSHEPLKPERYVPSTQKPQSELGLTLRTNLKDAILETIVWNTKLFKIKS